MNTRPKSADSKKRLVEVLRSPLELTLRAILDFAVQEPWISLEGHRVLVDAVETFHRSLEAIIETLRLISLSFRPLTYRELADLERTRQDSDPNYKPRPTDRAAILSWIPGVLDLHDHEVHLSHPTFRSLIFSESFRPLPICAEEQDAIHGELAVLCLQYFYSSQGLQLLKFVSSNVQNSRGPAPRTNFLSYAVMNWPKHAQLAGAHFPVENDLIRRFFMDIALLDNWAMIYESYTDRAVQGRVDQSAPLAIIARYGLDIALRALIQMHKGTSWLTQQLDYAIIAGARNGRASTVDLLFGYSSQTEKALEEALQASLQSRKEDTISVVLSKVLKTGDPSKCVSAALRQALSTGPPGIAMSMLCHVSWNDFTEEQVKEILLAASVGDDSKALGYVLDNYEGKVQEDDIVFTMLQTSKTGQAAATGILLNRLLKLAEACGDIPSEQADDFQDTRNPEGRESDAQPTIHEAGTKQEETNGRTDSFESVPEMQASEEILCVSQSPAHVVSASKADTDAPAESPRVLRYGENILNSAIETGHHKVIQTVLHEFHQRKIILPAMESFLRNAISLDRPKCFKVLLDSFSQAERLLPSLVRASFSATALLENAVTAGNVSITRELLCSRTDLDNELLPDIFAKAGKDSEVGLELMNLYRNEGGSAFDRDMFVEKLTEQLAIAVQRNAKEAVARLIQAGADINRRNLKGSQTPLYHSVYYGYVEVTEILLKAKADTTIAEVDSEEWLPIHAAYDNVEILRRLLAAGADVNGRTKDGETVLSLASKWGYRACVEEILKKKPELDYCIQGTTILLRAVDQGSWEIASLLLDAGTNPTHPATKSVNAPLLRRCVTRNQVDLLRKLLLFDFDLEHRDSSGRTALNIFNSTDNIPALRLLIRRGADINTKDSPWNDTPLSNAILADKIELVKFLISEGADVNAPVGRVANSTPLFLACEFRSLEMVKVLIESGGANTNFVGIGPSDTLFQVACENNTVAQPDVLSYLLDNNLVDTGATSERWGGNLSTACLMADITIIERLIQRDADIHLKDRAGREPIHFALLRTIEHVKCLCDRENGAKLLAKDSMHRNALHIAVMSGRLSLVKYIIERHPDMAKEKDCDEWTPLFWAVRKCSRWGTETEERGAIIKLLKDNGADIMEVGKGFDRTWTPYMIARYHNLGEDIVALVTPSDEEIAHCKQRLQWTACVAAPVRVAKHHEGAYCDICLVILAGAYYVCLECPNFALCFKCYRRRDLVHDSHGFIAKYEDDGFEEGPGVFWTGLEMDPEPGSAVEKEEDVGIIEREYRRDRMVDTDITMDEINEDVIDVRYLDDLDEDDVYGSP